MRPRVVASGAAAILDEVEVAGLQAWRVDHRDDGGDLERVVCFLQGTRLFRFELDTDRREDHAVLDAVLKSLEFKRP